MLLHKYLYQNIGLRASIRGRRFQKDVAYETDLFRGFAVCTQG